MPIALLTALLLQAGGPTSGAPRASVEARGLQHLRAFTRLLCLPIQVRLAIGESGDLAAPDRHAAPAADGGVDERCVPAADAFAARIAAGIGLMVSAGPPALDPRGQSVRETDPAKACAPWVGHEPAHQHCVEQVGQARVRWSLSSADGADLVEVRLAGAPEPLRVRLDDETVRIDADLQTVARLLDVADALGGGAARPPAIATGAVRLSFERRGGGAHLSLQVERAIHWVERGSKAGQALEVRIPPGPPLVVARTDPTATRLEVTAASAGVRVSGALHVAWPHALDPVAQAGVTVAQGAIGAARAARDLLANLAAALLTLLVAH